jgi:hypothetical protein
MQGKLNNLQAAKRELWPLKKLSNILFLFLALGGGVLLGLVMSLHVMGYFGDGSLLQSFSGAAPSQQQRQRAVHAHVISTKEHGYEPFDHRNMPDEVLLWRASMFPHRPGIPIPRTPKVAFLFLTVGPLPLGPLWERFFHGHEKLFNIYVHSLPGFEPDHARSSVFFGRHIPSQVSLQTKTHTFVCVLSLPLCLSILYTNITLRQPLYVVLRCSSYQLLFSRSSLVEFFC